MKKLNKKMIYKILRIIIIVLCVINLSGLGLPYLKSNDEYKEALMDHPNLPVQEGYDLKNKDIVNMNLIEYYKMMDIAQRVSEKENIKPVVEEMLLRKGILIIIAVSSILLLVFSLFNKNILSIISVLFIEGNAFLYNKVVIDQTTAVVNGDYSKGIAYYIICIVPIIIFIAYIIKIIMELAIKEIKEERKKDKEERKNKKEIYNEKINQNKVLRVIKDHWFGPLVIIIIVVLLGSLGLKIRQSFKEYDEQNKPLETSSKKKETKKPEKTISNEPIEMTRENVDFTIIKNNEDEVLIYGKNNNEGTNDISIVFYFYDDKDTLIKKSKISLEAFPQDAEFAQNLDNVPNSYHHYEVYSYVDKAEKESTINELKVSTTEEKDTIKITIKRNSSKTLNSADIYVAFFKDEIILKIEKASLIYNRNRKNDELEYKIETKQNYYADKIDYDNYKIYINSAS